MRALLEQLATGSSLSLMSPLEVESGASAVRMRAVRRGALPSARTARTCSPRPCASRVRAPGGEIVLHYGMHGFHDWFVRRQPARARRTRGTQ
jgi:hypothetical protein